MLDGCWSRAIVWPQFNHHVVIHNIERTQNESTHVETYTISCHAIAPAVFRTTPLYIYIYYSPVSSENLFQFTKYVYIVHGEGDACSIYICVPTFMLHGEIKCWLILNRNLNPQTPNTTNTNCCISCQRHRTIDNTHTRQRTLSKVQTRLDCILAIDIYVCCVRSQINRLT